MASPRFKVNSKVPTIPGSEGVGMFSFEEDAADAGDTLHGLSRLGSSWLPTGNAEPSEDESKALEELTRKCH